MCESCKARHPCKLYMQAFDRARSRGTDEILSREELWGLEHGGTAQSLQQGPLHFSFVGGSAGHRDLLRARPQAGNHAWSSVSGFDWRHAWWL